MKKFNVEFLHSDGSTRKVVIEAFDKERARGRFIVNWGEEMNILSVNLIRKKTRLFDSVEINDTVSFENEGMIETGVCVEVNENTFKLRVLSFANINGVKTFYDSYLCFYKTGKKSHTNYTYGNAIKITGKI